MKKYAKIDGNNKVIQTQRSDDNDFIECPEYVSCGMIKNGDLYESPPPPPPPTQQEIEALRELSADIEQWEERIKAFALVMLDEINILRNAAGLQPRTVAQLKQAVKNRL